MKSDKFNNIFLPTGCISENVLWQYAKGQLSEKEQYMVEKHLTDCDFCSDVVEGMSLLDSKRDLQIISKELNASVRQRTEKSKGKIRPLLPYLSSRWVAAASVFVLVSLSWFTYHYFMQAQSGILAEQMEEMPVYTEETTQQVEDTTPETLPVVEAEERSEPIDNEMLEKRSEKVESETTEELEEDNNQIEITEEQAIEEVVIADEVEIVERTENEEVLAEEALETATETIDDTGNVSEYPYSQHDLPEVVSENDLSNEEVAEYSDTEQTVNEKAAVDETESSNRNRWFRRNNRRNQAAGVEPSRSAQNDELQQGIYTERQLNTGMYNFNQENYDEANAYFLRVLIADSLQSTALFYSALCYINTEQNNLAMSTLDKLLQQPETEYSEAAKWHKALILIEQGDPENARVLLLELKNSTDSSYKEKAIELLETIDE